MIFDVFLVWLYMAAQTWNPMQCVLICPEQEERRIVRDVDTGEGL